MNQKYVLGVVEIDLCVAEVEGFCKKIIEPIKLASYLFNKSDQIVWIKIKVSNCIC